MIFYISLVFIIIILAAITSSKKTNYSKKSKLKDTDFSFSQKSSLLTVNEQLLFNRLIEAFPNHHIFVQVSVQMVVYAKSSDRKIRTALWNKINRKVFDFVICDRSTRTLCVIELDDSSHDNPDAQRRDNDKNLALKSANIPLHRFRTIPSIEELKKHIRI